MSISRKLRIEILQRDLFTCQDCGRTPDYLMLLHVHHIIPRRDGGTNDPSNLITLCSGCHHQRPEDYNHKSERVARGIRAHNCKIFCKPCGCYNEMEVKQAMLFSGEVAIFLECSQGHQEVKFVNKWHFEN